MTYDDEDRLAERERDGYTEDDRNDPSADIRLGANNDLGWDDAALDDSDPMVRNAAEEMLGRSNA